MRPIRTIEEAEAEARKRFGERAAQILESLWETFLEALPGNHSAAEAVLLAQLMTASDGYNDIRFARDWERRPRTGWATSIAFLAKLDEGPIVSFAIEARYDAHTRQLVVILDQDRPGQRVPRKLQRENALLALGYQVISFTEMEILSDPENCRERVESVVFDMVNDVLADAGLIPASPG